MHAVDVPRTEAPLADAMIRMRTWLDDREISLSLFRLERACYRLEFVNESEAVAFADAFGGCVIENRSETLLRALVLAGPSSHVRPRLLARRSGRLPTRTRRSPIRATAPHRAACG